MKRFAWMWMLAASTAPAWAYSLGGPINEAYQVRDLGYNISERGDLVAPKNLGEEYRRNLPIMYYSFDQNFLEFYGDYGAAEVDKAYAILNGLTNVSSYSIDLNEFPLESRRENYRAAALSLFDLKSHVLGLMVEQLGLADPVRYVWSLHYRNAGANCPIGNEYLIQTRNFGIVPGKIDEYVYSPYVNGVLYTYAIIDFCANPPPGYGLSEAGVFPVDLGNYNQFLPVASTFGSTAFGGGLDVGSFFTGLTRDDVAGLRYLLRAGNANWEDSPVGTTTFVTNSAAAALSLLVTSNLTELVSASFTNTDAGLLALYPNLVISSSIPTFTNVVTSNLVAYYTNFPWSPAGISTLVITNQLETNVALIYQRTFANVVTNYLNLTNGYRFPYNEVFTNGVPITSGTVFVIETNIGTGSSDPWGIPGTTNAVLFTNVTYTTMTTNMVMGDYFVVPTNACGFLLLSNVLTKVYSITNTFVASNNVATPPPGSITVSNAFSYFSRTEITYWTNHNFAYFPVLCSTNQPSLRRGAEKLRFVRRDYDSLLGQYWYPQTNFFTLTTVTNSKDSPTIFQRVVTQPDFLFSAQDFAPGPSGALLFSRSRRNINFFTNNSLPNLAGPGTIIPVTLFTFNKSGPIYYNISTNNLWSLDDKYKLALASWGSFDDSTNPPVVYPNSVSLDMLESRMLLTLTPSSLNNARVNVPYLQQFHGAGGQPPYTIALSPDSPALPPGLSVAADGSGMLYGTATEAGIFDFMLRLTDANGRFSDWLLTLTITQ